MKTIKIFLASSEELTDDRNAFGNLVRRLDKIYEKRGIRIELFEWEDYDAAYNDRRKQDEYNDQIKASDMFLALFHTKAGKFTIEEFDVATEEFKKKASPKVYTYCRDLQPGEVETPELIEFKRRLFQEMGHYWSRYGNRDTMQLHFVMQLQLVETGNREILKVENGEVFLDNMHIASVDNLSFVTQNEGYQKMKSELESLPMKIAKKRQRMEEHPDDEEYRQELQELQNRYNDLKDEFATHQQALFNTAKRIAEMQIESVSSELRRAIQEFEAGHVEATNAILDGIRNQMKQHKEQTKRDHAILHQDIQALLLQTRTLMADVGIPIEERIERTLETYLEADDLAGLSALEPKKYASLLSEYSDFLETYGLYDESMKICLRLCRINEELYGPDNLEMAESYNMLGVAYYRLGNYVQALEYYQKALVIREKLLGPKHTSTANSYNNIGTIYHSLEKYELALEYYKKALGVFLVELGTKHPTIASLFHNIGMIYNEYECYEIALEYNLNALRINKESLGQNNLNTAISYYTVGRVYFDKQDYNLALDYFLKAREIYEELLGPNHPDTSDTYKMLEKVYVKKGKFDMATIYSIKSDLREFNKPEKEHRHHDVASLYKKIGGYYTEKGDYRQALDSYQRALYVDEKWLGKEHMDTIGDHFFMSMCHYNLEEYEQALEHLLTTLPTWEKLMGTENQNTASVYTNIGSIYACLYNYNQAMEYYQKAYCIFEKELGSEHPYTINLKNNIEMLQEDIDSETI